jgi:hypothetical protein
VRKFEAFKTEFKNLPADISPEELDNKFTDFFNRVERATTLATKKVQEFNEATHELQTRDITGAIQQREDERAARAREIREFLSSAERMAAI